MTQSNADRQRAYRQRRAGLVLVRRWVRPELAAQVKAYADALMTAPVNVSDAPGHPPMCTAANPEADNQTADSPPRVQS